MASYSIEASGQEWETLFTDMSEAKRSEAIKFAKEALQLHATTTYSTLAENIKNKFDEQYGGTWQCIVGIADHFGLFITHELKQYIRLRCGELRITLFMTGVCFAAK